MSVIKVFVGVLIAIGAAYGLNVLYPFTPAVNPDPNHAHADFAVWIAGTQLDFSDEKYMSGSSKEPAGEHDDADHKHPSLHLHDGNGHVVHRHKPGLTLGEFFASLGYGIAYDNPEDRGCWYDLRTGRPFEGCQSGKLRLFVNGSEHVGRIEEFVFRDGDQLLLTDATDPDQVEREFLSVTDDACLYSKTCPWRGEPPTESCVADPAVPCVQ